MPPPRLPLAVAVAVAVAVAEVPLTMPPAPPTRHELIQLVIEAHGAMGMPAAQCAKWRRKLWGHWPFYVSWCLRIDGWYPGWRVALERMRASGTMPAEAEVEDV